MLKRHLQDVDVTIQRFGSAALAEPRLVTNLLESPGFAAPELQRALAVNAPGGCLFEITESGVTLAQMLVKKRRRPFPFWESWITPLSPSGMVTLAASDGPAAVEALLNKLKNPVLLRQIPVEEQTFGLLQYLAGQHQVLSQWQRAALKTEGTFDSWLQDNFDQKRRKELKRLRARLSEQGALETQTLSNETDLASFIDDFLRLEASGWKGQKGTALQQDEAMEKALRQGLANLLDAGKLRFWRIVIDGKAIASLFAFVDHGRATLGKIAYDQDFAKYSPGVLIILDATEYFFSDPGVHFADSNAIPGHPMIDRIWRDRLSVADVFVAPHGVSPFKFRLIVTAEKLRHNLRNRIKTMYYKAKRKSAS